MQCYVYYFFFSHYKNLEILWRGPRPQKFWILQRRDWIPRFWNSWISHWVLILKLDNVCRVRIGFVLMCSILIRIKYFEDWKYCLSLKIEQCLQLLCIGETNTNSFRYFNKACKFYLGWTSDEYQIIMHVQNAGQRTAPPPFLTRTYPTRHDSILIYAVLGYYKF